MKITTNAATELATAEKILELFEILEEKSNKLRQEAVFLSVEDVMKKTGFSKPTVLAIFNRPDFPLCDYGKAKKVYFPAFHEYFMNAVRKDDF